MLPTFLKRYFWDVSFEKMDLEKRRVFVLKRVLEYGDEEAVFWMKNNFQPQEIEEVLTQFRGLSHRSANYWALIYDIDRSKVRCLQKPYLEMQKRHWPY